jgi:hypothetical protein
MLEIDANRAATASEHVIFAWTGTIPDRLRPIHPQDLGAHVRQHHPGEGARADPGQLDDLETL